MKPNQIYCNHQWKITQGFTNTYTDCSICGLKFEDYESYQKQDKIEIKPDYNSLISHNFYDNKHFTNYDQTRNQINSIYYSTPRLSIDNLNYTELYNHNLCFNKQIMKTIQIHIENSILYGQSKIYMTHDSIGNIKIEVDSELNLNEYCMIKNYEK